MPLIKACTKDDVTNYKTDKTYTEDEGATKYNPNDQQVFATGTWAFTNNETVLSLTNTGTSAPENYTIVELTSNALKISHTFEDDGVTYTNTRTFSH